LYEEVESIANAGQQKQGFNSADRLEKSSPYHFLTTRRQLVRRHPGGNVGTAF